MANGKQTKVSKNEGYLSDESDFYGDSATKESFEDRASEFDDTAYWKNHQPSLTEKADANVAQALASPPPKSTMYNPYAGQECAWQLEESVEAFLKRLPPKTTQVSESIPWIYITNPFREAPKRIAIHEEAPPDKDSDWGKCVSEGNRLLQELRTLRNTIEKENSGKSTIAINRLIDKEKEAIVQKILDTAIDCQCTTGKWMIFCLPSEVNEIWSAIAKSTSTNSLGIGAKVAPDDGSGLLQRSRLICVYTENFSDKMDVYRVLKAIKELGLVDKTKRGTIYYKADIYTYLQLTSSNPHDIKASLYNSQEFLQDPPQPTLVKKPKPKARQRPIKKENVKVDTYFRKIKKETPSSDLDMH
ncbi:hypothetical protein sscle_12g088140 [Sclerotinia sclerotiorum 1980 UF-70]|uniref:DUF1917 domain-containing protein n=1 Tax=Sclerotinia sclerotiorum (strain ATCC 18683 / 1980 / Ss-1) TaxID=665079 RepID=A0A1D9QGH9_SCLS1|nr:hypothetical protein sscle_12g088140 [Sclerotinia sclerotiorum 1980 UF-70]